LIGRYVSSGLAVEDAEDNLDVSLWPMAGAQSIEIVATLPTSNEQP
jgi:hypothetical protein